MSPVSAPPPPKTPPPSPKPVPPTPKPLVFSDSGTLLGEVLQPLEVYHAPWGYKDEAEWHAAVAARDARLAALVPMWSSEDEINLARRVQRQSNH